MRVWQLPDAPGGYKPDQSWLAVGSDPEGSIYISGHDHVLNSMLYKSQQTRRGPLPVEVTAENLGRYGRDVEAAIYFSVLEALQNTTKYSQATSASVLLEDAGSALRFAVRDDGQGFDAASVAPGAGLTGMADRLDTVGGTLAIDSNPGGGTVVTGSVPARELTDG